MCRLAFIQRPFDGLVDWLTQLEHSYGGHGTGVASGRHMRKSCSMTAVGSVGEIFRIHRSTKRAHKKRSPFLWHSRRASSGGHHDDLCHPFACDGGWLAHNGHWHVMHEKAKKYKNMSDTRMFSILINRDGFLRSVEQQPPGVWLHMLHDGRLAVSKRGGDLWFSPDLEAIGSEPAQVGEWLPVDDGVYDYDEPLRVAEAKQNYHNGFLWEAIP